MAKKIVEKVTGADNNKLTDNSFPGLLENSDYGYLFYMSKILQSLN